jgi:hypothetical protein
MAGYLALGGPWWLFVALALAPDIAMVAYLAGPRRGSLAYNATHTTLGPISLGAVGFWTGTSLLVLLTLVWAAHIGVDRALGYGLKYPTGFTHTHLGEHQPTTNPDPRTESAHVDATPAGAD